MDDPVHRFWSKNSSSLSAEWPSEDFFRLAARAANDCLWDWNLATGRILRSDAMVTQFGYSPSEIHSDTRWWRRRIHPEDRARACRSIDQAVRGHPTQTFWTSEYRFRRRDGSYAEVCDRAYIVRDAAGQAFRVVGAVLDLTKIRNAQRVIAATEERYRYTVELTGQIAWSASADGTIVEFDNRWAEQTGLGCVFDVGDWDQVGHPEDVARVLTEWRNSIATGCPLDLEHRFKVRDGSYRWFRSRAAPHFSSDGQIIRWYGTIEDIHDRQLIRAELERLASFDELTMLRNRHAFVRDLEAALSQAKKVSDQLGLLVLDLDDFKYVNDVFGHDIGDRLLAAFAERMRATGVDIYRTGGDEFAVFVEGCRDSEAAILIADKIHGALEESIDFGEIVHECRVSIGCALFPLHGGNVRELLKSADIALYAAKASGRKQTRIFASEMRSDLQKRTSMLSVARQAIAECTIDPVYQPQVDLRSGEIVGFEALLRFGCGTTELQPPAMIWAAFDHAELAVALADQVLDKVLAQIKNWNRKQLSFGRIAINASPLEFRGGRYAQRLLDRLEKSGVAPSSIEVEVTESVFLEREEDSIAHTLALLRQAGITVALDDFGTGYAALSHLTQFPVDLLKIDRTFIRDLPSDARQASITQALMSVSQKLGIRTVAEGIETSEQAVLLRSYGCELGQGFFYGCPMSAEQAEARLSSRQEKFRTAVWSELRAG